MRWLALGVEVDGEAAEAAAEILRRYCQGGVAFEFAITPGADEGYLPDSLARVVIRGYVPLDDQAAARRQKVEEGLWHLGAIWPVGTLQVAELEEADWANAWKAHYHPFRVGRCILISPAWVESQPYPDEIVVALDPGMAFGTGLHPTTQMALRALEDLVRPGQSVLDLGTGFGILAIAAAKLGAGLVLALDVDSVAVEAARANVSANGVAAVVTVEYGSLPMAEPRRFDVVVANIIARVIADLAEELAAGLLPGGTLVAGGLIEERAPLARARLEAAGFVLVEQREGDWLTLIGRIGS